MSTFPNHFPSDRRYSHGEWPVTRHRFMANTEQRMLHATAKTKQELRLTFANRPTEIVQQYLDHFNSTYGTQFAFEIPAEVFAGWTKGQNLLGRNLLWQYKEPPRVSSPRGGLATLQVTLIVATDGLKANCGVIRDDNPLIAIGNYDDVTHPAWSSFMSTYAIWYDPLLGQHDFSVTLYFANSGTYTFITSTDNAGSWGLDGDYIYSTAETQYTGFVTQTISISSGVHTINARVVNTPEPVNTPEVNPGGWAMQVLNPDGTELWNSRMREVSQSTSNRLGCDVTDDIPAGRAPGTGTSRFPAYYPSSRTFKASDWNTKKFAAGKSGQITTIPLPWNAVDSDGKLSLTFANRDDEVAEAILDHYDSYTSNFKSFQLSSEIWADWNSPYRIKLLNAEWIYDAEPVVTTNHIGTSTTTVRLAITKYGSDTQFAVQKGSTDLCLVESPYPAPGPAPGPDSGSGFANVLQTSGWTHCRFRIKPGSINCDFESKHHGSNLATGFIQNNPENWILAKEPSRLRSITVDGQTHYWYEWVYTMQFNPNFTLVGPHSGYPTYFLYEPRFDGSEPETEFYTGHADYVVVGENHGRRFWVRAYNQRLERTSPPWQQLPTVSHINYYSVNYGFYDASAIVPASYYVPGLEGSMYMAGWEYQLWLPDRNQTEPVIGGPVRPYITEGSTRTRWRNDGEGGRWLNVNENWNRGQYGGGLETAPWLMTSP